MADSGFPHSDMIVAKLSEIEKLLAIAAERMNYHVSSSNQSFENLQEVLNDLSETLRTIELREATLSGMKMEKTSGFERFLDAAPVKYSGATSIILLILTVLYKLITGLDVPPTVIH